MRRCVTSATCEEIERGVLSPAIQAAGWKEALEGFVTQRAWHCRSCHQCEIRKGLDKLMVGIHASGVFPELFFWCQSPGTVCFHSTPRSKRCNKPHL